MTQLNRDAITGAYDAPNDNAKPDDADTPVPSSTGTTKPTSTTTTKGTATDDA